MNEISTHSFRKFYATEQYKANENNILLVKELLNHSSVSTTQKYIGIKSEQIEKASSSFRADF
jgi:site-specific recombinase XerD